MEPTMNKLKMPDEMHLENYSRIAIALCALSGSIYIFPSWDRGCTIFRSINNHCSEDNMALFPHKTHESGSIYVSMIPILRGREGERKRDSKEH
jgi:hypothetical protein